MKKVKNSISVFCCAIPRANSAGISLEVNKLRLAETRHTPLDTEHEAILLCMTLLEPGYRVYVYSQHSENHIQVLQQRSSTTTTPEVKRRIMFAGKLDLTYFRMVDWTF